MSDLMTVEELLSKIAQLSEEHPEFQERIAASLMSVQISLRKAANYGSRGEPVEFESLPAWAWLEERFGGCPTYAAVSDFARDCAAKLGLSITRDILRRLDLIVVWFDSHLIEIIDSKL
jgi:hypothetical protein